MPVLPGRHEVPFPVRRGRLRQPVPIVSPGPTAGPALDGPTGPALGRCEVVLYTHRHDASFGGPLAHRARPRPRGLDRPGPRALERSGSRLRLRLREPRLRGRRDDRASARADLRARPRPTDHRGKGGGTPASPRARREMPLVRGDVRTHAPTASSRRTRASSSRFPSQRGGRSRSPSGRGATGCGAWPSSTRASSATSPSPCAMSSGATTLCSTSRSRT